MTNDIEALQSEVARLTAELRGKTIVTDDARDREIEGLTAERDRLKAALERIAKDPGFGASLIGPAHGAGMYTGWIIARDIARAALAGTSEAKEQL